MARGGISSVRGKRELSLSRRVECMRVPHAGEESLCAPPFSTRKKGFLDELSYTPCMKLMQGEKGVTNAILWFEAK